MQHVGNAVFVDPQPLTSEEIGRITSKKGWRPGGKGRLDFKVHPYVEFVSAERAYYGLMATRASLKTPYWIASVQTGTQVFENVAPLLEFNEALEALHRGDTFILEEVPFSEVMEEEDYLRAAAASLDLILEDDDGYFISAALKRVQEESAWEGPGVYDMRDKPPTKAYGSAVEYEVAVMEEEASNVVDYMFQGDEWRKSLKELLEEVKAG